MRQKEAFSLIVRRKGRRESDSKLVNRIFTHETWSLASVPTNIQIFCIKGNFFHRNDWEETLSKHPTVTSLVILQHRHICFWLLIEERKDNNPLYTSHLSISTLRHHVKKEGELTWMRGLSDYESQAGRSAKLAIVSCKPLNVFSLLV